MGVKGPSKGLRDQRWTFSSSGYTVSCEVSVFRVADAVHIDPRTLY